MTDELEVPANTIGNQGPDLVYIGLNERNQPVHHDRTFKPHLLVSGETRGGKGGLFQIINAHDSVTGNQIYVVAPDPGEYGWLHGAATVGDEDQAPHIITHVHQTMNQRRQQLVQTHNPMTGTQGLAHYRQLPDPWHHVVLTLDEAPAVLGDEATLTYDKPTLAEMSNMVAAIAKRGAKVGVHLLIGTQYPTIEATFGSNRIGGAIKSQLAARIHFDRNTESLHSVFRNSGAIGPNTMRFLENGGPGRGAYSMLNPAEGGRVSAVQVAWIEPENVRRYALAYRGPVLPELRLSTVITPGAA